MQQPQKAQQPLRVPENNNPPKPTPRVHVQYQVPAPDPRVNPRKNPNQEPLGRRTRSKSQPLEQPISRRTRLQLKKAITVTPAQAAQLKPPNELLALWCTPETSLEHIDIPVLDPDTDNTMEYRQLHQHSNYRHIWETSYFNELGRLCQGIGRGDNGPKKQCVAGTETFKFIRYEDIPQDCHREVCHKK